MTEPPTCDLCGAPVHDRHAPDEHRTWTLDAHAVPRDPGDLGFALRVDGTAYRVTTGSGPVYRPHICRHLKESPDA